MQPAETLTPERWRKVKQALDAALEAAPSERRTVLERHLGDDPTLVRDATAYLALDDELGDFIENPALSLSPRRTGRDPMAGHRIGPYKLDRLLGRGGMGSVYLAVREDDYEKRVAVKLIHRAMSTAEMVERFRKERQILAHLEHPNIARLLDGGTTDEDLPYFVMEYVEGEPIDLYCDHRRLSTRERLALFRRVCSAVHFAHRNLVVHRDLKPGNILVDARGVPKLLDFGIAKLLDGESVTRLQEHDVGPMTCQYASPEQVLGEPVTTASDVYSLGVLLYELLCGHLPLRREQYRHPAAVVRAIGALVPPRPSTAMWREEQRSVQGKAVLVTAEAVGGARDGDPSRLARALSGDVDAIALKALRREPEHRYGSAEQFSEDIRRHLQGLPVEAQAGTFAYRATKFMRRNRVVLATATAFATMVVGFVMTLAVQLERTKIERNRATMSMDLLVDFLESPDLRDDEDVTPQEVIDRGLDLFGPAFASDLEAQANTLNSVALVYSFRGLYDRAEPLFEHALEMRRELWGERHVLVAESLQNLALLLWRKGDHEAAARISGQALEIQRERYGAAHRELAKGMTNHAVQLNMLERHEEAEALFHEALEMQNELYGTDHLEIALTLANLGTLDYERGDYLTAQRHYRRSLEIRQRDLPPGHAKLGISFSHMGRALVASGDYEGAIPMFRRALEIRARIHGEHHPDVARSLNNLAFSLERVAEHAEARNLYERALEIRVRNFGKDHPSVATVKRNLASLLLAVGEPQQAEILAREALEVFRSSRPEGYWRIADVRSVLGACLGEQLRFEEAESLLAENHALLLETKGEGFLYTEEAARRLMKLRSKVKGFGKSLTP